MYGILIRKITVALLLLSSISTLAQVDLSAGFTLLEDGQFNEAREFFEPLFAANQYDNKTISICYGRAVGLSGQPTIANEIFQELDKRYPGDIEVLLNLSESWLWLDDPVSGTIAYTEILQRDSTLFPALLGLANAQASSQLYLEALGSVNKALEIDSTSSAALTSRKYILLGLSADLRKQGQAERAMKCIDSILVQNPIDPDALLNKAETYMSMNQYKQAQEVYDSSLGLIDSTKALSGIAYTSLVLGQMSSARKNGTAAYENALSSNDTIAIANSGILLSDILGASGQFKNAHQVLDTIETIVGTTSKTVVARARLLSWSKDFSEAGRIFEEVILRDSTSAEAYMGFADQYYAASLPNQAADILAIGIRQNPDRPDLRQMRDRIMASTRPQASVTASGMTDNGGNQNIGAIAEYYLGSFGSWSPRVHAGWRRLTSKASDDIVDVLTFGANSTFQLNSRLGFSGEITAQNFKTNTASDLRMRYVLESAYLLKGNHSLSLGLAGDYEEYSAQLILENIKRTTLRGKYQVWNARGFGLYSQFEHAWQSDGNTRNIAFISAYCLPLRSPLLKAGVNFSYLGYEFSRPEVYYSPTSQTAFEAFSEIKNPQTASNRLTYRLQVAVGTQSSDLAPTQFTIRCSGDIGYTWNRFNISLYSNYGNIASDAINGYVSYEAGIRLSYRFN